MPTLQNPSPAIIDPGTMTGIRARYKLSASGLVAGSITGQTIPDLSGNGHDLTVSGTATYYPSRINGKGAVVFAGGNAQAAGFFADVPGDWSVVAVHKVGPNVEPWWDGTAGWWCRLNSASPPVMTFLGIQTKANGLSRNDGWQSYCGTQSANTGSPYTGGRYSQDFSGWESSNPGGMSTSDRPLIICRDGAYELAEWIYFDRYLTWAERVAISRYFAHEYGVYSPFVDPGSGHKPFIVAVGNSTTQFPKWPSQLAADATDVLGGAANLGIAGGTAATIDQQAPEMLDLATTLRTLGVPVLKVVHHGHNNSYTVIDHLKGDSFSTLRALGERLMVSTSTPYNDNDGAEVNRTELNDWIRGKSAQVTTHGNPLDWIDYPVDAFGKDYEDPPTNSVISYTGKYSNTSESVVGSRATYGTDYWSDNIHPTELAGGKMAGYIQQAVRDALSSLAGLVDPKTVAVGSTTSSTASLTAPAATGGFAPYTYQWYRNGTAVSGATSATLNDTGLTASTSYSYVRRATDAGGFYRESPAATATTQAAGSALSVTLASSAVTSTTATVTATPSGGIGAKTYAWTRNGSAVAGETGAVLNLTGLTASTSYTIGVTVTDSATPTPGTVTASTTVTTTASGSALSVSLAKTAGTSSTLTIVATATGGTGSKTYAWTRNGTAVAGQTTATLNLTGLTASTSYTIGVTVTDSATPTPGTATATLSASTEAAGASLAVSLVKIGGTATTMVVQATATGGTGSKSYAWTLDGSNVSSQTGATATFSGLDPSTTYTVGITVTDSATPTPGTASSTLSATTAAASDGGDPLIVSITTAAITATTVQVLTVANGGWGMKSYRYFRNGFLVQGASGPAVTVAALAPSTSYVIEVQAQDEAGTIVTASVVATTQAVLGVAYQFVEGAISKIVANKPAGTYRLTVEYGDRFGFPTPASPIRVTILRRSTFDPLLPYQKRAVYSVVGREGNDLLIESAIGVEGDVPVFQGEVAAVQWSADYVADLVASTSGDA